MNPAAEARAKVLAAHPEAAVVERGRNHIKHRLADAPDGKQRFALDCAIGPLHYGPGNDQEIDTALQPSVAPWDWEMTKAGFEVRALSRLDAGQVVEYRAGDEWVRFQPMALQYGNDLDQVQPIAMPGNVQAAVDDDTLTWADGYGPGRSLSWQAQTARLAKRLTIASLASLPVPEQFILDGGNPCLELNLIFAHSNGVTPYVNGQPWSKGERDTQSLVEFRDGEGNVLWWFNLPRSWDAEGNGQLGTLRFKKQGNSLYVSHRVPLGFVQGAAYPLSVDVDVDDQIDSSNDDASELEDTGAMDRDNAFIVSQSYSTSQYRNHGGLRFHSGSFPANGSTIDVAYLEVYVWGTSNDDANFDFHADDRADPPEFGAGAGDITDRTLTTASAAWVEDSVGADWQESPSIVDVIQELVTDYTVAAVVIILKARGDAYKNFQLYSWDGDSDLAAKLHIEYTAAVGGVTVTPPTATLTTSTFSPVIKLVVTPGKRNLSLATFTPVLGLSVIPPPLALSLATFVPTVTTTANVTVTPGVCTLSLGLFAPTVMTTANVVVIPPPLALSLTAFAPTVTATGDVTVIPGTVALSLTAFAPTVTITGDVVVTPGVLALSLATFAPVIKIVVTPPTLALNLQTFAPTISTPRLVTPPTASLSLAAFAPTVSAPRLVTPGILTLSISLFAPTVTTTGNVIITPGVLTLSLDLFAPTVSTPRLVTPGLVALSLTTFIPTITVAAAFTAVWFDSGSVALLLVLDGSVSLPEAVNDGTISIKETEDATT